ncbi:MAG: hypothetical protein AAGJ94_01525 [Pseudomonadota bacterium]
MTHIESAQTLSALRNPAHIVGIPAFRGLAIFDGDEVVVHRYAGWFDVTDGEGDIRGSALWEFDDGRLVVEAIKVVHFKLRRNSEVPPKNPSHVPLVGHQTATFLRSRHGQKPAVGLMGQPHRNALARFGNV